MKINVKPFLLFTVILCYSSVFSQTKKTYLALGDSYTIGESVKENLRWPNQLSDSLSARGIQFELPKIIARTGWRTDELIAALQTEKGKEDYDLVSLLIGVNNQYQNKDIEVFQKEFAELIKIAIQHSKKGKKSVFVLSIPDYGATPFGQQKNPKKIDKEIQQYNAVCRQICDEHNIPFYEITEISKRAKTDLALVAVDGLHPSGAMYSLWVQKIINGVYQNLSE